MLGPLEIPEGQPISILENSRDAGWTLSNVQCFLPDGSPLPFPFVANRGDFVECVFTNEFAPPPLLKITKITNGFDGVFDFSLDSTGVQFSLGSINTATGNNMFGPLEIPDGVPLSLLENSRDAGRI